MNQPTFKLFSAETFLQTAKEMLLKKVDCKKIIRDGIDLKHGFKLRDSIGQSLSHVLFYEIFRFDFDVPNFLNYDEAPGVFMYEVFRDYESEYNRIIDEIEAELF